MTFLFPFDWLRQVLIWVGKTISCQSGAFWERKARNYELETMFANNILIPLGSVSRFQFEMKLLSIVQRWFSIIEESQLDFTLALKHTTALHTEPWTPRCSTFMSANMHCSCASSSELRVALRLTYPRISTNNPYFANFLSSFARMRTNPQNQRQLTDVSTC